MRPTLEHGSIEKEARNPSGAPIPPNRPAPDAGDPGSRSLSSRASSDEDDTPDEPRPLTRAEAQALSQRLGSESPWRVLKLQAGVGCVVAVLAGAWAGESALWSALWGAGVIVVPGAVMARGIGRRLPGGSPSAGVVSFLVWEFVKIALSVVLLLLAVKVVQPLSWLALLVGLVVCAKVNWVLLLLGWWRSRGT